MEMTTEQAGEWEDAGNKCPLLPLPCFSISAPCWLDPPKVQRARKSIVSSTSFGTSEKWEGSEGSDGKGLDLSISLWTWVFPLSGA